MKKTYIIAEIGINHQGDINIAKRLIDIAAAAGCDAVKFQKRNPDVCVPKAQKNKPRSWQGVDMTYLEYKYKVEFGKEEYDEIDRYCKQQGIDWSASPWDTDSVEFLTQYNIPFIKLPSASLTNDKLLAAFSNSLASVKSVSLIISLKSILPYFLIVQILLVQSLDIFCIF